ncbi:hypothetical protein WA538_000904 [Blastocystis sp. DL]
MSAAGEKTESKPIDSDYYKWSKQISASKKELERLGVDITPTKIEGSSPVEPIHPQGVTMSAWNKAGTWEEHDMSKWAKERIPQIFKAAKFDQNGYTITFTDVEKCDGQATYVFTKGKKKPGFDFNLKIKWSAEKEDEEEPACGYVVIDDFSDTSDGDYEWSFKANKSDEFHTKAKAAVQASKKSIEKLLNSWIEEFKSF